jgi:aromatase
VIHTTSHDIAVAAPPTAVYGVIADVTAWPHLFPPTIHAERVAGDDRAEQIRLWALAGDAVKTWTSRRTLDPALGTITFRQEAPHPPVTSMTGTWSIQSAGGDGGGGSVVTLTHEFSVADDTPANLALVGEAIEHNSRSELAAMRTAAEHASWPDLLLSFSDSVLIDGATADVYEFLYRCAEWPQRLPHVSRLDLTEDEPGVQMMEMDTRTVDGDTHSTKSVRICFEPNRIVYKQTVVPPYMLAHTGEWTLADTEHGVETTARHTVLIDAERAIALLGPGSTIDDVRAKIRSALGTNSRTTLRHAKDYVERERAHA